MRITFKVKNYEFKSCYHDTGEVKIIDEVKEMK